MSIKGILIPIGGNEDKGKANNGQYRLEYIEEGILSRVVRESGGKVAHIVVVPTASSIPNEVSTNYQEAFQKLGCTNVEVMDIRERSDSDLPVHLEMVSKADCLMFSGGNQSKISENIFATQLHKLIMKRFQKERFVIAGPVQAPCACRMK